MPLRITGYARLRCIAMPVSKSLKRAQDKFEQKIKRITFRLNPDIPEEKEMINYLEKSGNKQGTIKKALKYYMHNKDGSPK